MQRRKKLFQLLLILLSVSILRCMSISKNNPENKKEVKYLLAFANDPNGIVIYKNPKDLNSKIGVIPYKEKYLEAEDYDGEYSAILEYMGKQPANHAGSKLIFNIQYKGVTGYLIKNSTLSLNFDMELLNTTPFYGVVESFNTKLYESPFIDSRELGSLSQFQLLEKPIQCKYCEEQEWRFINFDGKFGYTNAKIFHYEKQGDAKEAILNNLIHEDGYFKITAKSLSSLDSKTLEPILYKPSKVLGAGKEFRKAFYSIKKQGEKYYAIGSEETVLVSEKSGVFIQDDKFADYISSNKSYKKEACFLKPLTERYRFSEFNFFNVEKKYLTTKNGITYYFISPRKENPANEWENRFSKGVFLTKRGNKCAFIDEIREFYDYQIVENRKERSLEILFSVPGRGGAEAKYAIVDGEFKYFGSYLK